MPQLASITISDAATTPVAHTYTPRDIVGGIATLSESTGVPIGDNRITMSLTRTSSGRVKPSIRLNLPVTATQTVNGVATPTVVRTAYVELNFSFENTSTTQERKDAMELARQLLFSTQSIPVGLIRDLQTVY